ncbi:hypothetical protein KHS38_12960 [Mucilaginibacter sp. Bleaf8]|uniref:hypothetical protein n=1 Tax=Mucilaginibacter sp. Bleaf8 TaxID=2834430 RepID=UPI001BCE6F6C|nr:hypothetical protein [Mucilaginibacter sp. Bleaf8]MBS7565316.1 hypothetical protein [Mucilaginibacter sp. Bleaf8]
MITGSPVTQIANKWEAVSPYDLLYIVGKYITEEDLRLFESLFLTVMSAHDPTLDLEPHLRVAASLYKKEDQYSKWLKTGISQTLALLSIFGEDSGINTSIDLHAWINQIVRKLLNAQELRFWQTIESKIDILAEAAPQAFLGKMEDLVQKHPELIAELFNDQESGLWSHPYHTHILWALEVLAWDASLLPRVTFLLAKIIRLDKGTAYANRPAHTLSSIFRWWYPQTFATYQDRKELLNTLAKRFPDVALSLIISLTPQLSEVAMDTHKPVWRMRERYQIKVSQAEYIEGLTFNCDKLLELAGSDPQKWVRVIELADDHQGFLRDKIIEKILTIDFDTAKSDNLRERLYTLMRSHAAATKKDSSWRLSSEHQAALKQVYDKINRSAADRYISYFNAEYIESRSTGDDWEKQQKLTAKKRTEAIGLIIKDGGLESVYEMIPKVKYPFWLGRALSKVHKKLNTDVILKIEDGENFQRAVIGYISGFAEEHGTTWIEKQVKHFTGKLADQHLIAFYLATEACPVIWESVKKQNTALYDLYWQVIFTGFYHPWFSAENNDAVIQHLNSYKRYSTSLNCIYDEKRLKPETVAATLIGYVADNTETDKPLRSQEYQIRKLYKYLLAADYDPDQMHLMEWYYFKLLKKDGHEKSLITYLYDNLNKHPDFFARLVQFLYIPEEGTPEEEIKGMSAENVQGRAQNADAVLNGWIELPGLTKDGTADFEVLKQYITDALEQCSILKRKKHGTREIGKLLGRAEVPGSDWPHPEICEIIESYDYPDLNEGFFSGYYNRHAGEVRIRPATASYDSDSSEVVHLKALSQNLGSKYPVTARIINDIALSKQHWIDFMNKRDRQDEF